MLLAWGAASCASSPKSNVEPFVDAGLDAPVEDAGEGDASCSPTEAVSGWAAWPMPDPSMASAPNSPRYDTSSAEVVVDLLTGLAWQRAVEPAEHAWQEAKDLCDCSTLGGFDDWRLPTRIELVSIVDFTKGGPAVDPVAFPATPSDYVWSASRVAGTESAAWYVYFLDGNTHSAGLDTPHGVRCVRATMKMTLPSPRYGVPGDGTVLDVASMLVWQRDVDDNLRTWADAKNHCAVLSLAGGGWRLPNMKELQALIDETAQNPAIDTATFGDAPPESFWTSTPLAGDPTEAWFVSFYGGVAYTSTLDRMYRTRCVR